MSLAFCVGILYSSDSFARQRATEQPIDNPDLDRACGLDVLMILDESGSINSSGATDDVRDAFKAFTEAIQNTSSRMAVAEFSKVARLPNIGSFQPGEYITVTTDTKTDLDDYVDNNYNPGSNTNWEDGLRMGIPNFAARENFAVPHLTVFITDGDPTQAIRGDRVTADEYTNKVPLSDNETTGIDKNPGADRAVGNANNLKSQGSHILAIAVGDGVQSNSSLDRIEKISGPDIYDGSGPPFNIETDDIYAEEDFGNLQDALREAAFQLCSPSVTIEKLVDLTPDPDSLDDALPGDNWTIEGGVSFNGNTVEYDWVLPMREEPGDGPMSTLTDASGFATFQWLPDQTVNTIFTATETLQRGFVNDQSATQCTFRTPDTPDQTLQITVEDRSFTATIIPDSIVTCQFVNIAEPAPNLSITKFTDGDDANVEPGPSIPEGDEVVWTYRIQNTGNLILRDITLTDQQRQPTVETAVDITSSCPQTELVQGETMFCTVRGKSGQDLNGRDISDALKNNEGQYENLATVSATDSRGNQISRNDPSHYVVALPGVSIEKSTNGRDADIRPGPILEEGDPVTWEYVVTNTSTNSNVVLENITVTDNDPDVTPVFQSGDSNNNNRLETNETWIYRASGFAERGQYDNRADVDAFTVGSGIEVTDEDPSHYFGAFGSVSIQKTTNDVDADAPPGPFILVGDQVNWVYTVTNNGNVPLITWDVTDDQGVKVNCPRVIILPGSSASCVGEPGVAQPGQYANVATVTANNPFIPGALTDTDPSHYFGEEPALDLEKSTNGEDADSPTGPVIEINDTVNWVYQLTNSGNTTLTNLVVVDDRIDISEITCPQDTLGPAESINCTATGTAEAGQYANRSLAIARGPGGPLDIVGDIDPSHYFGAEPGIRVEKLTNGLDADTPEQAARVPIGDQVLWFYEVSNTGNAPLSNVTVTDDQSVIPVFTGGDDNVNGLLDVGEFWTYEAMGIAIEGQYTNVATARGTDPAQVTVEDTDPSNYFGFENDIKIEKSTNTVDADLPQEGPFIPLGEPVTWEYLVSNEGSSNITDVVVTDDQNEIPVFQDGDTGNDNILGPGETWRYTATGNAVAGQYANIATVEAVGEGPQNEPPPELTDTDPSHYFGGEPDPEIVIEKSTNGVDADEPVGPLLETGSTAVFVYVIENTGDIGLDNVAVTDDQGVTVDCAGGNPIPRIEPGNFGFCQGSTTVTDGQYRNVATVVGEVPGERGTVRDTDPSHHFGFTPTGGGGGANTQILDIEKATNGVDADEPDGPRLTIGTEAQFTYLVSNIGTVPVADISVTDDQGLLPDCPSGNPIPLLEPGLSETCTASTEVLAGQYVNIGTARGRGPSGPVSDTDPSHHFGQRPYVPIPTLAIWALGLLSLFLGLLGASNLRRR